MVMDPSVVVSAFAGLVALYALVNYLWPNKRSVSAYPNLGVVIRQSLYLTSSI